METTVLEKDINVLFVEAKSFPEGIMEAHQKLHGLVPFDRERKYFGISRPEDGTIVYKAGMEEAFPGEASKLNCQTVILKKGRYVSRVVRNYPEEPQQIGETFNELLTHDNLDPQGYCVEWYQNEQDVKCMIRLKE